MTINDNNLLDFVLEDNVTSIIPNYKDLLLNVFPQLVSQLWFLYTFSRRIVFGIKLNILTGELEHEFYLYNTRHEYIAISPNEVLQNFIIDSDILLIPEVLKRYFMYSWSFDIWWKIQHIDYYMSDSINYRWDGENITQRNHYSFFNKNNIQWALNLLMQYSDNSQRAKDLLMIFWNFLVDSWKVCIANKWDRGIWIYHNRIDMEWFHSFLRVFQFPQTIQDFFSLFQKEDCNIDTSIDFSSSNGVYKVTKVWFYGVI